MTTVAFRDGVLAADSFVTDETTAMQVRKIVRLPKGDVAGGAGPLAEIVQALQWLAKGCKGDPPAMENASILFTVNGVLHYAACGWPGVPVKGYAAIGSGAQGALVAMKLGMTAEQAVAAVIGVDYATGGEIEVLAYTKPKRTK